MIWNRCEKVVASIVALAVVFPVTAMAADIPSGLSVPVELTTDAREAGAVVSFKVTAPVQSAGSIIIPEGSIGSGRVLIRRDGSMWGNPGKTEVSLEEVTLPDGTRKTVNAKFHRYGADQRVITILLSPFLAGFFIKGGSGKMNQGSRFTFQTN